MIIWKVTLNERQTGLLHAILLPNPMHPPRTTAAHQTIITLRPKKLRYRFHTKKRAVASSVGGAQPVLKHSQQ